MQILWFAQSSVVAITFKQQSSIWQLPSHKLLASRHMPAAAENSTTVVPLSFLGTLTFLVTWAKREARDARNANMHSQCCLSTSPKPACHSPSEGFHLFFHSCVSNPLIWNQMKNINYKQTTVPNRKLYQKNTQCYLSWVEYYDV